MRWPWRRRPKAGRVVFLGAGAPWDVAAALAATPTPSPVVEAFVPEPEPEADTPAGVQLGFADGSTMTLSDDDPRAVALRAAAARLTGAH